MAKSFGAVVTGVADIDKKLKRLPLKLQKKLTRQATRKAAKEVVLLHAKTNVPTNTGKLAASLAVRAAKARKGRFGHQTETKPGAYAGADEGEQYPGAFLEFGTKERFRKPITTIRDGAENTTGGSTGRIDKGKFGYLRAALYDHQTQIQQLFIAAMREFLNEAAQ